ncbi:hypothetical protein Fmac_025895 [Flemingia macrophylla]|uniref:Uncharacterized protein n=1 Tax=Flemingia macrophylla TaxID=520843 RepID=A0ABD1LDG4_9FABA
MASSSSAAKRCHYEVLGLSRDCGGDEIRSAYRRLALQRHPDKLVKSGLSAEDATAQFQELQHAYEVLSDPKERAWYDSHRSQILFSDPSSLSSSLVPDLFSFFSNTVFSGYSDTAKGFYSVYSAVFDKIQANEITFARKLGLGVDAVKKAPLMGNLDSPYAQVTAFYGYWLGFSTVMDFCWVDEYDAMAGPNRKSRRLMEEENNKARRKARREYNDTVRRLGDFVKKRDKRVIDMRVKRSVEMERKKEEERERKRRLERERKERALAYEEPEWARVEEDEVLEWDQDQDEEKNNERQFYCVLCGKKFKSEKQWKNHEQSKKHKERVAEFRDSIGDEEGLEGDEGLESEGDGVGDMEERFRDGLNVEDDEYFDAPHENEADVSVNFGDEDEQDDENGVLEAMVAGHKNRNPPASTDKRKTSVNPSSQIENDGDEPDEDEDENDVLEAMVAGIKNRKLPSSTGKPKASVAPSTEIENDGKPEALVAPSQIENEDDEVGPMEYNNRKSARKRRGAKKEKGRKNWEESQGAAASGNGEDIKTNGNDNSHEEEPCSQRFVGNEDNDEENGQVGRDKKKSNQPADKRGAGKDTKSKAKVSSKGRKTKVSSKNVGNICEACGEEFDSRNKLHKHLGDSGHATIKGR